MAANVVEEFLINAELAAVDIPRVLLADESNPEPSSAKVWAIRKIMPRWRVPELSVKRWNNGCGYSYAGSNSSAALPSASRSLPTTWPHYSKPAESGSDYTPKCVSHLSSSRPRAGTS